jgi:hypothetical protein
VNEPRADGPGGGARRPPRDCRTGCCARGDPSRPRCDPAPQAAARDGLPWYFLLDRRQPRQAGPAGDRPARRARRSSTPGRAGGREGRAAGASDRVSDARSPAPSSCCRPVWLGRPGGTRARPRSCPTRNRRPRPRVLQRPSRRGPELPCGLRPMRPRWPVASPTGRPACPGRASRSTCSSSTRSPPRARRGRSPSSTWPCTTPSGSPRTRATPPWRCRRLLAQCLASNGGGRSRRSRSSAGPSGHDPRRPPTRRRSARG